MRFWPPTCTLICEMALDGRKPPGRILAFSGEAAELWLQAVRPLAAKGAARASMENAFMARPGWPAFRAVWGPLPAGVGLGDANGAVAAVAEVIGHGPVGGGADV